MSWGGTQDYTNGVSNYDGYGDTGYNPFANMTFPSLQLGFYLMGLGRSTELYPSDISAIGTSRAVMNWWANDNYTRADLFHDGGTERLESINTSTGGMLGVVIINRDTTTNANGWINGSKWAQSSVLMDTSTQLPDGNVFVFQFNSGNRSNRKHGCAWVADGMADDLTTQFTSIIIKYMSSLGRAVN